MVNAISEHTSTMSGDINAPICIDDDDEDETPKIDKDYKLLLDHLRDGDNSLGIRLEDDNGESETRKFDMCFGDSKRSSKVENENQINNRVSQQRKRKIVGFDARSVPFDTTRQIIQRDNRRAERRKRKIGELEEASWDIPLVRRNQEKIQRDNRARRISESKVETLRDVPLVRTQEVIQRDNKVRKFVDLKVETLRDTLDRTKEDIQRDSKARRISESKVETLRNVPLVRTQEVIQRDSKARTISESKFETLRDVPLVRTQEVIERDSKARKFIDVKVETLRAAPLARTEEDIQRDNKTSEQRKKKNAETRAAGTSRVVPDVDRVDSVTKLKNVDETSRFVPVIQSNKGVFVGKRKKSVAAADQDYMSYLTWLVDSLTDSTAEPDDPSDIDPPIPETQKDSTFVPGKDLLVKVKAEPDLEYLSDDDDDDLIAISDFPFPDGDGTTFVASKSKNVIDLEKESTEDESNSCRFKRKLMDVLKKPFNEREFLMLSGQASMKRPVTRCRELRQGRESRYETDELGPSYLEMFPDFDEEYRLVDGDDKASLELLRGFFFYLENVSQVGSFKPWTKKSDAVSTIEMVNLLV